jgi:hypothetical protein
MPYDLPSFDTHTRNIKLPDGMNCVVAMSGWHWNSLDWINDNTDWSLDDFIGISWRGSQEILDEGIVEGDIVKKGDNLAAIFTKAFEFAIEDHMQRIIAEENAREAIQAEASQQT